MIEIPDEAVEKAARELWERASSEFGYDWTSNANQFRTEARGALTAALPVLEQQIRAQIADEIEAMPLVFSKNPELMAWQHLGRTGAVQLIRRGVRNGDQDG